MTGLSHLTAHELLPLLSSGETSAREVTRAALDTIDEREPLKLPVIQELTRILPQDTWLTDMSMIKNKIEIKGFSASAAKLIPIIENSPFFKDTAFNGSIVRQKEGDKFTIRASLNKRPA